MVLVRMQLLICFIIMTTASSSTVLAQIKREKWNDLRVTWGPNPLSTEYFVQLPRTKWDALNQGFVKISDCDSQAKWRGYRYVKDNDYTIILLYDVKGYIAGIQTTVAKGASSTYPSTKIQPPFVEDGDRWTISAYFTEPSKICTTGRTAMDFFYREGTGSNLYIQNSSCPESSVLIPTLEADTRHTQWTEGKCFPTMGKHYWYNPRVDMPCDEIFPVFLLYNKGYLNAFGWFMLINLPSKRYEHPTRQVAEMFMKSVPSCLDNFGTLTTMHIYLTNNVTLNQC